MKIQKKLFLWTMKFDPWVISSISDSISSAAFLNSVARLRQKIGVLFNQWKFRISITKPPFSLKKSQESHKSRMASRCRKKNCHSSKDLLQLSPSLLLLLQHCGKNWPYSLCSLRDQKVTPALYYVYYVIGNVPFFLAAVGNRGWNRSHIRTTSYT